MNELVATAQAVIQQRLDELEVERKQLEQALRALRGQSSSSSGAAARRSRNGGRRGSGRATKRRQGPSAKTRAAVSEYLQAHPQAGTAEVVKALDLKDGRVVGAQRRKLTAS